MTHFRNSQLIHFHYVPFSLLSINSNVLRRRSTVNTFNDVLVHLISIPIHNAEIALLIPVWPHVISHTTNIDSAATATIAIALIPSPKSDIVASEVPHNLNILVTSRETAVDQHRRNLDRRAAIPLEPRLIAPVGVVEVKSGPGVVAWVILEAENVGGVHDLCTRDAVFIALAETVVVVEDGTGEFLGLVLSEARVEAVPGLLEVSPIWFRDGSDYARGLVSEVIMVPWDGRGWQELTW